MCSTAAVEGFRAPWTVSSFNHKRSFVDPPAGADLAKPAKVLIDRFPGQSSHRTPKVELEQVMGPDLIGA
jgi:hypothetical protein